MSFYFDFFGLTKIPTYIAEKSDLKNKMFLPFKIREWQEKSLIGGTADFPTKLSGLNADENALHEVQDYARRNWTYKAEKGDHWKTGPEMLRDKEGDCEDIAAGKCWLLSRILSPLHTGILITPGHASAYAILDTDKGYILDNGGLQLRRWFNKMTARVMYDISPYAAFNLYETYGFRRVKMYPRDYSISGFLT
ncbi:MAG: hypothetical protein GY841_16150 [FCB group bacterium]|nr:hypothetical protein [FCB group bacterium]